MNGGEVGNSLALPLEDSSVGQDPLLICPLCLGFREVNKFISFYREEVEPGCKYKSI